MDRLDRSARVVGDSRSALLVAWAVYGLLIEDGAGEGVNANVRLVALGAAAPYFYDGRRGRYASRLEALAKRARARHLGLWGACPRTPYDPYEGVDTGR